MEELNRKQIIIKGLLLKEGISKAGNAWAKVLVSTDQSEKYNIWVKKKDGTFTMAFSQLKAFGFPINKSVSVAYDVKDTSFKGRDGNMVEYKDRTIAKFEDIPAGDDRQAEHEQGQPERDVEEGMPDVNEPITTEEHDINLNKIPFN